MPFVVDGDNLLGTWPGRARSGEERRRLAFEIARWARGARRRAVVVFDGTAPSGLREGPDLRFGGHGRAADDVVLELLGRSSNPRGWVAVTDDRSLADRCRHLGARVERCIRFRARLPLGTEAGEKPEPGTDVDYWLEQFGGESDTD